MRKKHRKSSLDFNPKTSIILYFFLLLCSPGVGVGVTGGQRAHTQRGGGREAESGVTHPEGHEVLLQEDTKVASFLLQRRRLPAQGQTFQLDLMVLTPKVPQSFMCPKRCVCLKVEVQKAG